MALLAAACARNDAASTSISFDTNSSDGLVIVGFKGSHTWLDYKLVWWPIDPETKRFVGTRREAIVLRRGGGEAYIGQGPTNMRYVVFRAPAGELALHSTEVTVGYSIQRTRFRPRTAAISVNAGEIVYIGDVSLTVPERDSIFGKVPDDTRRARLEWVGRNDEAAEEALKAYWGVSGTPTFRRFHTVRVQ